MTASRQSACPRCGDPVPDGAACACAAADPDTTAPSRSPVVVERLAPRPITLNDALPAGEPEELPAGASVGEYRVEERIGQGGFGTVYRGVQPIIGKRVAIKVLSRELAANAEIVGRFVAEARAVNEIGHPNIVDIFSFGQLPDGRHYCVMELIEGETLDAAIEARGRLPPEEALPIFRELASALDAAHAKGIAHRDLKPENVLLRRSPGGRPQPKLLDFGIAKLLHREPERGTPKTRTGMAIGTAAYMSPEQVRGDCVDHRTDVYSFGVMAYEVLAGARPFAAKSFVEMAWKHMQVRPPPPSTVCPELPRTFDAPLLRMLEKEAGARPASVSEAVRELEEALQAAASPHRARLQPAVAPSPSARTLSEPVPAVAAASGARARLVVPAIAGLVLGAVGIGAYGFCGSTPPSTPPATGEQAARDTTPTATQAPTATAPQTPTQTATQTDRVTIRFEGAPAGTRVLAPAASGAPGVLLGTLPEPILLPRGTTPVTLELRARGFRPHAATIVPEADVRLPVQLQPARPAPRRPDPDDVEDF